MTDLRKALAQPVDETAKDRLIRIMGTFDLATGHGNSWDELLDSLESELRDVLGHLRATREDEYVLDCPRCGHCCPERKWVGLSVNEARAFYEKYTDREELIYAIDKFLEEKNGG